MNKIFIFVLLIGVALSVNDSPCVLATPTNPEDCFSLEAEYFQQTCCFFYGTYESEGKFITGPACLEAYKRDVSTGKRKAETQKKIEEGKYWKGYPGIKDIESFLCFDSVSECEKNQPVEKPEQCYSAHAELTSETCCFIESDWVEPNFYGEGKPKEEGMLKYCADIEKEDTKKIEELKDKIIKGEYWDGVEGHPNTIKSLKCFSNSLNINLIALALVLFIF